MHTRQKKFGIIGGGQLARMLALKCHQIGYQAYILSGSATDPAAQVTKFWVEGDVHDIGTLKSFLENVDFATFESEFLDAEKLKLASQFSKKSLYPAPQIMGRLQNRNSQKMLLDEMGISVVPWIFVEHQHQAEEVLASLKTDMILKKCRFGYDGYGTFVIHSQSQLAAIFEKPFADAYIAEAKIKFRRELAFMMARDQFGNIVSLPLVESHQNDSKCLWIKGPVSHPGFNKLQGQFKKFLKKLNYVGIMGIELFDCGKELLVNELAPRVHNSGHYSLDAFTHDQFLLHIMAVAGLKFPKQNDSKSKAFAMYNLIGDTWNPNWSNQNLHYHWYGKEEARPGRKMGHITALASLPDSALNKILKCGHLKTAEKK